MQDLSTAVALLAPVPENLLDDGLEVCAREGQVAFGSRAFEVFRHLDELRRGLPVRALLYASHAEVVRAPLATWTGRYVRYVAAKPSGRHPEGVRFRPRVGRDAPGENSGHWGIYWHVEGLRQLDVPIAISDLRGLNSKHCYAKYFVPEGPLLIEYHT